MFMIYMLWYNIKQHRHMQVCVSNYYTKELWRCFAYSLVNILLKMFQHEYLTSTCFQWSKLWESLDRPNMYN